MGTAQQKAGDTKDRISQSAFETKEPVKDKASATGAEQSKGYH